jgi:putative DNA methylase
VGRVLTHNGNAEAVSGLDDVTTYYLLHRHDFGLNDAPIGRCILYAVSCGLSDQALAEQYDLLVRTGGKESDVDDTSETDAGAADGEEEAEPGTGSKVKLKAWHQRKRPGMGFDPSIARGRGGRRPSRGCSPTSTYLCDRARSR